MNPIVARLTPEVEGRELNQNDVLVSPKAAGFISDRVIK
jgi:hypothetical protein